MSFSTSTSLTISFALAALSWGAVGYLFLKKNFPGKGLQVFKNIFKETCSIQEALKALKEGKRIRRKSTHKGYTRIVITEGKNVTEKYGTYWVNSNDSQISDFCSLSIEDVLADDWLIDE